MPISTTAVGHATDPMRHQVDARWIMAYAAGIGDFNPRYLDTAAGQVVAHPVFPVCLEWPAVLASRHLPGYEQITAQEAARGVHATHDLHLFRSIRAGDELWTDATIIGVRKVKPGAAVLTRLDTRDVSGALVCRTYQTGISRGVDVVGDAGGTHIEEAPAPPVAPADTEGASEHRLRVPEGAAHVYTECARIWNPIHTDRAVALAAGLPDIILHGTATLALAVSRLVDAHLGGDPARVERLGGRFSAMVRMPTDLSLIVAAGDDRTLFFSILTAERQAAFSQGYLSYR